MHRGWHGRGFTLIELVAVIVVLGILGVGISRYIATGTQIFIDSTERDQLLSDSRFLIERLNREIRHALPNSFRVAGNQTLGHCLEFVPVVWSTYYFDLPVIPEPATSEISAVGWGDDAYVFQSGHRVVVYPVTSAYVYQSSAQAATIAAQPVQSDGRVTITLQDATRFATHSPGSRLYVVADPVSYCVGNGVITRHTNYGINSQQQVFPNTGILMAKHNSNTFSAVPGASSSDPFRVAPASLTRNAAVIFTLQFSRDGEQINFHHEVHQPNVP